MTQTDCWRETQELLVKGFRRYFIEPFVPKSLQVSTTVGGNAMLGPVGISFDKGKVVDVANRITCEVSSMCAMVGLGLGLSADSIVQISGGTPSNGWQIGLFGKEVPFAGGGLSILYGSDGPAMTYEISKGEMIGAGVKFCAVSVDGCK